MPPPRQARRFCFTLNNPTDEHHLHLRDLEFSCPDFRFLIYQVEKAPSTGTEHIQGYLELNAQYRFERLLRLLPRGSHVESARGNAKQNVLYCSKPDSRVAGPYQYGSAAFLSQGKRNDIADAVKHLKSSSSLQKALETSDSFVSAFAKYHRGFEKIAAYTRIPLTDRTPIRQRRVVVLWGPTGTGKTHTAYSDLQARYPEEEPFICPDNSGKWFDGYNGHRGVIFDEFRTGPGRMPVETFLRLTDQYPVQVPIKGGFVRWDPEIIYLTSNESPEHAWYSDEHPDTRASYLRRLSEIRYLSVAFVPPSPAASDEKQPE